MVTKGFPTSFNFRGVLLDIDDTLYRYENCHQYALHKCYEYFNEKVKALSFSNFISIYETTRKRINIDLHGLGSSHSRILYFQKVIEHVLSKTDVKFSLHLEDLYWKSFLSQMKLTEEAAHFLEQCRENKIKICAVTDLTTAIQFQKLNHLNIASYFDFVVTSEEAGVEKPHPYIFMLALEKLNLRTDDVIVIGDNPEKDIKGAINLKIRCYHVQP